MSDVLYIWNSISGKMGKIQEMEKSHAMRNRFNPHRPPQQKRDEIRAIRSRQYEMWKEVKDLYAEHRDELSNTLDSERFASCRDILEKIFTEELDEALKQVLNE
jgi:hypothetical protein